MLPADEEASYSEGSHFEKHFFFWGGGGPNIFHRKTRKNTRGEKKLLPIFLSSSSVISSIRGNYIYNLGFF